MPMEMPKPTPSHKQLEHFAGTWSGDETMYASQWCPEGFVGKAQLTSRVALDGFYTIGDYEQRKDGTVTYRAHFVFGFDTQQDEVVLHWFDALGMGREEFRGKLEGQRMMLTAKNAMGQHRIIYDFSEKGALRSKMETSADGKTWSALFDGVYRKSA